MENFDCGPIVDLTEDFVNRKGYDKECLVRLTRRMIVNPDADVVDAEAERCGGERG